MFPLDMSTKGSRIKKKETRIDLDSDSLPYEFRFLHILRKPTTFETLSKLETILPSDNEQKPAQSFCGCDPPEVIAPQFRIPFRRSLLMYDLAVPGRLDPDPPGNIPPFPDLFISCVRVSRPGPPPPDPGSYPNLPMIEFFFGIDFRFQQVWNLTKVAVGDLSSTMNLAPLERVTVEILTSQRKIFEQKTLDSVEEITSTESTLFDKEVIDVVRSSARSEKWNIDMNAGINLGIYSFGGSGGAQGTFESSSKQAIQHISESTRKSSESLKRMHKIEVRGVTETFIQNRMTRTFENPYRDRALSLNIFGIVKQYSVLTQLVEIRPVLILKIKSLDFNDEFIRAHQDFLTNRLIDQSLILELPSAIEGAKPFPEPPQIAELIDLCKVALDFLFDRANIFNITPVNKDERVIRIDQNSVEISLDPQWYTRLPTPRPNDPEVTIEDSLRWSAYQGARGWIERDTGGADLLRFYTILKFFLELYRKLKADNKLDANVIPIVFTLKAEISKYWDKNPLNDDELKRINSLIFPYDDYGKSFLSEIYRRLSGFNSMVQGLLDGRLKVLEDYVKKLNERQPAIYAKERLLNHLNCNKNYYVQEFLDYVTEKTRNEGIVDLVNQAIDSTGRRGVSSQPPDSPRYPPTLLRHLFDIDRAFLDRQTIVVPCYRKFSQQDNIILIPPLTSPLDEQIVLPPAKIDLDEQKQVEDIEVPFDSVHLEVAAGACVLKDVPPPLEPAQPSLVIKCDCGHSEDMVKTKELDTQ
jgi:hypothetical protein